MGKVRLIPLLVAALVGIVPAAAHAGYIIASSRFNANVDGWGTNGDAVGDAPSWQAAGGNPGGYILADDLTTGETIYFLAPSKFEGNQIAAYGGTLSFDILSTGANSPYQFIDGDVMLRKNLPGTANDKFLYLDLPAPTLGAWTHFDVALVEGAWHVGVDGNGLNGPLATQADMLEVLADLTGLRIRGEYQNGSDFTGLDNVILTALPVPATLALLGIGLAGLGWSRRTK